MNRIMIRRGVAGDARGISRTGRESFSRAFGHLYPLDVLERYLDDTYSEQKIASSFSNSRNVFIVADVDDEVVGFLKLKLACHHQLIHGECQVQVQKIYVLPNFAGSGLGSCLMRSADAEIGGIRSVTAWLMVYEGNRRAVCFYERFGYRVIGRDTYGFEGIHVPFTVMEKNYSNELRNTVDSR